MNLYIYVGIVLLFFIFVYLQNNNLRVHKVVWKSAKIPPSFHRYKILHLSDSHQKVFGRNNRGLLKEVERQCPDLIVITGDVVFGYRKNLGKAIETVKELTSYAPTYFVNGNHEFKMDEESRQELYRLLEKEGIRVHNNRIARIRKKGEEVVLLGIDDPTCFEWKNRKEEYLELLSDLAGRTKKEEVNILLAHRPERFALYRDCGFDLVLSGHVHGGQIRLPRIGGLYSPEQGILPKYQRGLYREGDTSMVVSAGLGPSIFPFRINNYPEIVVVELQRELIE